MTPMAYLYICDGDIDDPVLTRKKMDWPEKYPHWQEIPLVMAQPEQELLAWKNAALRVGEDLSSVGPKGYYNMTAQQWLDWAMAQQPRGNNSLAQPEQEFVAYIDMSEWPPVRFKEGTLRCDIAHLDGQKLYTTPPQRTWVGLTKAQCGVLWKTNMTPFEYYQAIEDKLKEKNNG